MEKLIDAYLENAETLGWKVNVFEEADMTTLEFEKYSPAGEDFSFCLTFGNFNNCEIESSLAYVASSFDPDEHAAEWYGANLGEPGSLEGLIEDAKGIKRMLEELADNIGIVELTTFPDSDDNYSKSFSVNLVWFFDNFIDGKPTFFREWLKTYVWEQSLEVYNLAKSDEKSFLKEHNCDDGLQEYTVCIRVLGRYKVRVKAPNIEAAKELAEEYFSEADFGELECIDGKLRYVEDESENRVWEDV